jgi:GntR family transcriptional regulator
MTQQAPLSQRLHEQLGKVIAATKPGDRLPTEPVLARQMGVSRATLREAMRTFETQGLILRRQGVGTFVLRPGHVLESGLEVLESLETVAQRIGLHTIPGEITIKKRAASPEESIVLGLSDGEQVVSVSRVIQADARPVAYLIDTLPADLLTLDELGEGFNGSVLDLLMRRGNPPLVNSHCDIAAVAASSDVARALNIQRRDALLQFTSRLFTIDGQVIDYSFGYFLPGYFRFHVVRELN